MKQSKQHRRKALWIGLLLAALLAGGCAGIERYEPRDHREEGPEKGLISGADGEFVIYRKVDEPDAAGEADSTADESGEDQTQEPDSEEKKTKSSGQKP